MISIDHFLSPKLLDKPVSLPYAELGTLGAASGYAFNLLNPVMTPPIPDDCKIDQYL